MPYALNLIHKAFCDGSELVYKSNTCGWYVVISFIYTIITFKFGNIVPSTVI